MNINDLKELGFSEEDILHRVVDNISERILYKNDQYPDHDEYDPSETTFAKKVKSLIEERINEAVEKVAEKHTLPNITEYLENLLIEKTNHFGEKKGEPVTFIEYLTTRATNFLTEKVDYSGKSRKESYGSWSENTTRVSYMVDKHLQYSISTAIKNGLADINGQIADGLDGAVKIQLKQALENLSVKTEIKNK